MDMWRFPALIFKCLPDCMRRNWFLFPHREASRQASSVNNTLQHLDPLIELSTVDVWIWHVVFRHRSASAVLPMCVYLCDQEEKAWLMDPECLWAAVLCWAHHLWPRSPHLHGYRDSHPDTSAGKSPEFIWLMLLYQQQGYAVSDNQKQTAEQCWLGRLFIMATVAELVLKRSWNYWLRSELSYDIIKLNQWCLCALIKLEILPCSRNQSRRTTSFFPSVTNLKVGHSCICYTVTVHTINATLSMVNVMADHYDLLLFLDLNTVKPESGIIKFLYNRTGLSCWTRVPARPLKPTRNNVTKLRRFTNFPNGKGCYVVNC